MTRVAGVTYGGAAIALPAVAYLAQPESCFRYLYVPTVLLWLVLLCVVTAAVQPHAHLARPAKFASALAFAIAIQAAVAMPCVSQEVDSPRILRLTHLILILGWVAAIALSVTIVGLLRARPHTVARAFMALGLGFSAISLALGATKQYVGITGVVVAVPEVIIETHLPTLLQGGILITLITVLIVSVRHPRREPGAGGV